MPLFQGMRRGVTVLVWLAVSMVLLPFELRVQVDDWIADPDRQFMAGADVRAWPIWNDIVVDQLGAGELVRLAALLRLFEEHPVEAAGLSTDVIWAAVGERGPRKRHGLA